MKFLGMEQSCGKPTKLKYPVNTSKQDHNAKRKYIQKIASAIVDEYVVDNNTVDNEQSKAVFRNKLLFITRLLTLYRILHEVYNRTGYDIPPFLTSY